MNIPSLPPDGLPLEPDADAMRTLGGAALEWAVAFVTARADAPASDLGGAYDLAAALRRPPPQSGESPGEALGAIAAAAAKAFDTAGPGYLAYIPGGGLFTAAVADFLACVTNRFVNLAAPAPALVQLEANVARWLCDVFSLPPESQGILTSGGSMANLSAIVTARSALLDGDSDKGTMYVSRQAHHSIAKAARIAGLPTTAVRTVPTDADLCLDTTELERMVERDRAAGLVPFMVTGNAGTTNTGAVDPLDELASFCSYRSLWFHADAAYGGFFQLTERGRARLTGIEAADSITLDPHKGMFLPYGTGSLLVRDGNLLRDAHLGVADYLQDLAVDQPIPNFSEFSPELSRDFRGLRVWFPLHVHGVDAFRAALDEKLDLAEFVYERLSAIESLEVPWRPQLSTVAFRPRAGDHAARQMLDLINSSRRIFLSSTTLDGKMFLRVSILSHRTHRDRIEEALEIIAGAASTV